jgi:Transcription factor zinc-finger
MDRETLEKLRARLRNAAAIQHEGMGQKVFTAISEIIEGLRREHDKGLNCPECASPMEPRGEGGLGGWVCLNGHGVWLERDTIEHARERLNEAREA